MMTHDEMIAVIAAHKEGKEIQFKFKNLPDWEKCREPIWDFHAFDYRVKPEPREPMVIWVNEYKNGFTGFQYSSLEKALQGRNPESSCIATRKFIEAPEEDQP